ncbi:hypothetical protein ACFWIA_34705 [Streptomyces sp. NPDC127068]|uniref:hypothetical protein n=1 Tax=Streptomyces sp. NPDC127068 TaxID=3347127 RepID=UPI003660272C
MTGSTPPRKRRSPKFLKFSHRGADPGPTERSTNTRDDERGHPASLEARDGSDGATRHTEVIRVNSTPQNDAAAWTDALVAAGTVPGDSPVAGRQGPARGRVAAVREGVREGVRKSGSRARAGLALLADRIIENAPRVPVRDLETLRRQFPGLPPEKLADKLVFGAANATSTVGAGVGAAAMLPVAPAMPAELAAEITGVAAIELKLIAELYEVYGQRPPGGVKERTTVYLTTWSQERGIDVTKPSTVNAALGVHMKRELRQQIMKRMVRNLPNLMPFMVGAAVGAVMNRRDTHKLARRIRDDLRKRQVAWEELPAPATGAPDELGPTPTRPALGH